MDDPILEKKLKKMFESRANEFPNESLLEARVRKNVYEQAKELQKEYGPMINFPEKFSNGCKSRIRPVVGRI